MSLQALPEFASMDRRSPLEMDRRSLLERALLLVGAASTVGFSENALARAARRPRPYLNPAQSRLLAAVADTIVPATDTPGALAAGVPRRMDAMLANWAAPATRDAIVAALGRIDAAARTQKAKPFAALSAADRAALLTVHDKAALQPVPPPPGAAKSHPFAPVVSVADNGYHKIKELVLNLYYFSEIASSTELVYEHVPGKFEPSIKLTATSRPYLGIGPF